MSLHFLIENKIINLQVIPAETKTASKIPYWIRENAEWWADGQISDKDFVSGIQYMMENGIIVIEIDGVEGDWLYEINGEKPGHGADMHYLRDGDKTKFFDSGK